MPTLALRHRIYQECAAFLTAYCNNDLPKLARHYGLSTNIVHDGTNSLILLATKPRCTYLPKPKSTAI